MTTKGLISFIRPGPPIAWRTGPLAWLTGRHVLFVCDAQNLELGARDLGYNLNWQRLRSRLSGASRTPWVHAVFGGCEGDNARPAWFARHAGTPTAKTRR
jgi:hypothetical protein